jgi:lipopolysaccharide export system permease protein
MRLLDRYLLRELSIPLAYCLMGFFLFWLTSDLLSELDDLQQAQLGVGGIIRYYWLKLPELLGVVVPVALLLASLYAMTQHARYNEIVAMRAAGVSLWRVSLPYLGVGAAASFGLLAVGEFWLPWAAQQSEEQRPRVQAAQTERGEWIKPLTYRNGRGGRIWWAQAFHRSSGRMFKVRVDWQLPDGATRKLIAEQAWPTNGSWAFHEVQELVQEADPSAIPLMRRTNLLVVAEFNETPENIRSDLQIAGALRQYRSARKLQLSARELHRFLGWHEVDLRREERAVLSTLYHTHIAGPWTCLVVVLIAIPFGAPGGRRNLFVGVASSIVIAFSFFVVREFGAALGSGGYLVPWAAAWLPNLTFAAGGVWMTWRLQRPI